MNCRGVAQVMEARLAARSSSPMQAGVLTQLLKRPFEGVERYLFALSPRKERRFCLTRRAGWAASACVLGESLSCHRPKRHQAALEEFRVANRENSVEQIDVRIRQRQHLRRTQGRAIH